jgi:hypothetical protein
VIVVMVTTLITAIGMLAVRNISQIDNAAGYGRQSAQTVALSEMGTTAAAAQLAANKTYYVNNSVGSLKCNANMGLPDRTCYPLAQAEIDKATSLISGETLLEPTVAGTDTGSFGPVANVNGVIDVEVTEVHKANIYESGMDLEHTPYDATLTSTARVVPKSAGNAPCDTNFSTMTVKKVMRAHVIF